ncbi:MAG: hypothetical protein IPL79_12095 [Myxococcales bacterium]|nr:hypothetical protein [Myxococcales bacterium]
MKRLAVGLFSLLAANCETVETISACDDDVEECAPVPPAGDHITSVAMGREHTCVLISTGQVKCWGSNASGMLGLESADESLRGDDPAEMGGGLPFLPLSQKVIQLTAGEYHTCVRFEDKSVGCWGNNDQGELGLGDTVPRGAVSGDISNLATVDIAPADSISAGGTGTCAVVGVQVFCWGANSLGQFGLGDELPRGDGVTAIQGASAGASITKVTLGYLHSCFTLGVGDPICVGGGFYGNLVQGDSLSYGGQAGETIAVAPSIEVAAPISKVAAGGDHTCVVTTDGRLFCYGFGGEGALGLGDTQNRGDDPGEVGASSSETELGEPVKSVAPSFTSVCAILQSGQVKCWGYGASGINGQGNSETLGDDDGETGLGLPAVALGEPAQLIAVSGGGAACALLDSFQLKCWGHNAEAQLGLGDLNNRGDNADEMGDALPYVDVIE